jgi:two-component system, chemotaxis family, sensor kinase CheA
MDEDEDFEALFFVECAELIEDLQGRLDALSAGDEDPETVNAAFRAVHSVKGGASAFGFESLAAFTHAFETVMDRIRSGGLAMSPELSGVLLRSADVMAALVDAARERSEAPAERMGQVLSQLEALVGAQTERDAAERAAPVEVAAQDVGDAPGDIEEPATVTVRFAPERGFLLAGFDPVRMIRAARERGLVSISVEGVVPPIEGYELGDCPLAWTMVFEPQGPAEELVAFFETYAYAAEVVYDGLPEPAPGATDHATADAWVPEGDFPAALSGPAPAPAVAETSKPVPDAVPVAAKAERAEEASRSAKTLRVDIDRVDRLVNLVGEVLIAQGALVQRLSETLGGDDHAMEHMVEALSRQTRELQESVMSIRAQPVRTVFSRLPRLVRDLADKLGKDARLVMTGEDVEVDTTVIEELYEPLVHMLRNSMDHGIEPPEARAEAGKPRVGSLVLAAEHRGGRVRITLADDGRGIDRDVVLRKAREKGLVADGEDLAPEQVDALIFHPGFSTAAQVSAVSGRGVGMDVVRQKIQSLGGRCSLTNRPGQGTEFVITLPLTLAVMDGMTVRVDDQDFILPVSSVVEALTVEDAGIAELPEGSRVINRRGAYLPLLSLREALRLPKAAEGRSTAVVIDTETRGHVAVLVDDLIGQRQVVLKSLEANVGPITGVSGATILGDGRVALVLDVPALFGIGAHGGVTSWERVH